MLELAGIANAELKLSVAAVVTIVVNGDAVIEPERADGQVETQAEPPVIVQVVEVEVVGFDGDIADVIEEGKAEPLDDGNAVLGGAEPFGIPANRFAKAGLARADARYLKPRIE
jgi:hypothetical protein